jgi:hypothetical protein
MASTYPGAIDNLSNPDATDPLSNPAHAEQHSDANDAIEAIENTLGVNPQGVFLTVAARMADVDNAAASANVSASAAAVSASAALVAQLDAAQSASDAEEWATKLVDPVEGSDYSAKFNANLAASSFLSFDIRYYGASAAAPTTDKYGDPLITGALYFNSASSIMFVRNSASAWQAL